ADVGAAQVSAAERERRPRQAAGGEGRRQGQWQEERRRGQGGPGEGARTQGRREADQPEEGWCGEAVDGSTRPVRLARQYARLCPGVRSMVRLPPWRSPPARRHPADVRDGAVRAPITRR